MLKKKDILDALRAEVAATKLDRDEESEPLTKVEKAEYAHFLQGLVIAIKIVRSMK